MTMDREWLIEKLKQATEPSREIDAAIWWITMPEGGRRAHDPTGFMSETFERKGHFTNIFVDTGKRPIDTMDLARHYTSHLADTLWLLPRIKTDTGYKVWRWMISNRALSPHEGRAYINNLKLTSEPDYLGFEITAATPLLALCIVCLQAGGPVYAEET